MGTLSYSVLQYDSDAPSVPVIVGLTGSLVSGGTFGAVNGSALTALNASALSSGTLPTAQTAALTGDVTKSAGSNTTTLANIPAIAGTNLTGTAASLTAGKATVLATARTIAGVSFDGSANIAIASTGLSDTANIALLNAANTFTAAQSNSTAGAASTPAVKWTGAPFAGTGTTSFPLVYINDSTATASTTLSTAGTYLGVNGHGSKDFVNFLLDGVSNFKVGSNGTTTIGFNCNVSQSMSAGFITASGYTDTTTGTTAKGYIFGGGGNPSTGGAVQMSSGVLYLRSSAGTSCVALDGSTLGPLTCSGIVGTTAVANATAGNLGETISSLVATGSAVSLTTATAANVTSISLTAGDWWVQSSTSFKETVATASARSAGISTTSATLPTDGSEGNCGVQSTLTTEVNSITNNWKRVNVSSTTTVYLVASANFSAGTVAAYGSLIALRASR